MSITLSASALAARDDLALGMSNEYNVNNSTKSGTRKRTFSSASSNGSSIGSPGSTVSSPTLSSSDKKRGWTLVKGKDGKLHKRRRREKWNDDEHDLFIDGMKRFKRNWSLIAKHVGTKSAVQVRTHAYSHFNRRVLNSAGTAPSDIIKKVWKNNIEEIPRDPFQILQQNEALASRQLPEGLSPRSAAKFIKKQNKQLQKQKQQKLGNNSKSAN